MSKQSKSPRQDPEQARSPGSAPSSPPASPTSWESSGETWKTEPGDLAVYPIYPEPFDKPYNLLNPFFFPW